MTENNTPTLSERIESDGIKIVWGENRDVSKIIDNHQTNRGTWFEWRLVLACNLHGSEIAFSYGNSIGDGTKDPDVNSAFAGLVSNAIGIETSEDFPDWMREHYEFSGKDLTDNPAAFDHIDKAWKVYNENVAMVETLRKFLGAKFDDYLYDTEFDI